MTGRHHIHHTDRARHACAVLLFAVAIAGLWAVVLGLLP
ncbi:hypothetical protein F4559_001102 [Saccharothrix violaceirubra]|uniref:Uncharacterized protein n=1 Tax=Saccharothrix violaceirubra TaxID=413306 RepID=A0A7W7SZE9_9PSEU|nr:hypothetical protein [Saccharothrix violaceirubra]